MDLPLVSVVVVTYQHASFINKTLDSILSQKTNFNYEIILGEDDSIDGTRQICIDYANKFPSKIKLILHSRDHVIYLNGKPSGRYNLLECLKQAKGKYISICEGDDYWIDVNKLQKQVDFLEFHDEFVFVASNTLVVDENGEKIKETKFNNRTIELENIIEKNILGNSTNSVLYRSNLISSSDLNKLIKTPVADWFIWLMLLRHGNGYIMSEYFGAYRIHGQGLWNGASKKKRYKLIETIYNHMFDIIPEHSNLIKKYKRIYILNNKYSFLMSLKKYFNAFIIKKNAK